MADLKFLTGQKRPIVLNDATVGEVKIYSVSERKIYFGVEFNLFGQGLRLKVDGITECEIPSDAVDLEFAWIDDAGKATNPLIFRYTS